MLPVGNTSVESDSWTSVASRYPRLDDALHTREGFIACVRPSAQPPIAQITLVYVGFMLVVFRVAMEAQAIKHTDASNPLWWAVLWAGPNGAGPDLSVALQVWVGLATFITGVLLLVSRWFTHQQAASKLFDDFSQRGYLTQVVLTNILVNQGRIVVPIYLFGSADSTAEQVAACLESLRDWWHASSKYGPNLGLETIGASALGQALCTIDPQFPAGMYVATNVGFSSIKRPRVVIPMPGDPTRVTLYTLRRNAFGV